jgi:hypothetical protein
LVAPGNRQRPLPLPAGACNCQLFLHSASVKSSALALPRLSVGHSTWKAESANMSKKREDQAPGAGRCVPACSMRLVGDGDQITVGLTQLSSSSTSSIVTLRGPAP